MTIWRGFHVAAMVWLAGVGAAVAQGGAARIDALIDELGKTRTPTAAAISPDGQYVAWAVNGAKGSELHVTGMAQVGAADRVIAPDTVGSGSSVQPGRCTGSHPAWSPDGRQLAFLSDCSDEGGLHPTGRDNIFVWTPAGNGMKQVSHLRGQLSSLKWSPDGKTIGFLFVENATRQAGALDAMKPWSGVIGEDGVEVQRVYAVPAVGGTGRWVTPASLHVYEFSWSPKTHDIAFVAANAPGENNWWVAKLYTTPDLSVSPDLPIQDREKAVRLVLDPVTASGPLHGLQIAVPRFSPDETRIAFIGGLMSDQGSTGGDVYVIPAAGGEPVDVTPGIDGTPAYEEWLNDNRIGLVEERRGELILPDYDVEKRQYIEGSADSLGAVSVSGGDVKDEISYARTAEAGLRFALVKTSFSQPPEVFAGPLTGLKQLSHLNDGLKPAWGKAESVEWMNEGFHIQGWLLYPAGWTPGDAANGKKYPLIVSVHGGPSSEVLQRWPGAAYGAIPFSALGYFVFMPNPRGSFGQGEAFTEANRKDFGYGDLRDVLAGMDVLEKRFPIDKEREGLTGWSYGGFMTMFGVTQTTRFKAAVAGAGISDWLSYYGENSIDQWMVPFFGATVYDDPAVYAKSSAIDFIKNVKTPTLVVVGDRDGECPAPQSFEFWHALKAEGVKTQLVVYPDEGHHFNNPEHQRDVLRRALEWFEEQGVGSRE
jgi:dipeptidyl aminopeptidase/acylaminoacyl peptidase